MSEEKQRLSDRVLAALKLSVEQKDLDISEILAHALELSLTRGAGGADFEERREFTEDVEKVFDAFEELKHSR